MPFVADLAYSGSLHVWQHIPTKNESAQRGNTCLRCGCERLLSADSGNPSKDKASKHAVPSTGGRAGKRSVSSWTAVTLPEEEPPATVTPGELGMVAKEVSQWPAALRNRSAAGSVVVATPVVDPSKVTVYPSLTAAASGLGHSGGVISGRMGTLLQHLDLEAATTAPRKRGRLVQVDKEACAAAMEPSTMSSHGTAISRVSGASFAAVSVPKRAATVTASELGVTDEQLAALRKMQRATGCKAIAATSAVDASNVTVYASLAVAAVELGYGEGIHRPKLPADVLKNLGEVHHGYVLQAVDLSKSSAKQFHGNGKGKQRLTPPRLVLEASSHAASLMEAACRKRRCTSCVTSSTSRWHSLGNWMFLCMACNTRRQTLSHCDACKVSKVLCSSPSPPKYPTTPTLPYIPVPCPRPHNCWVGRTALVLAHQL